MCIYDHVHTYEHTLYTCTHLWTLGANTGTCSSHHTQRGRQIIPQTVLTLHPGLGLRNPRFRLRVWISEVRLEGRLEPLWQIFRHVRAQNPILEGFVAFAFSRGSSDARLGAHFRQFSREVLTILNFFDFALKKFRFQSLDFLIKNFLIGT